ncbi:MAG: hypothetical protein K9W43_11545 [Candidatus Thorarchaeota archaeon]|nr:hypothetical protein [Candidatus Thorarchaeota archaeon]
MFSFRYPTKRQSIIWLKRRQEVPPSQIAVELGVSRPFVSQAQRIAEQRISKLLVHTAKMNRIKLEHISKRYGFAIGYCPANKTTAYITYSPEYQIQVWYDHEGDCSSCPLHDECEQILKGLALEWKIGIPQGKQPTEIAKFLFDNIKRRLSWE